MTQLLVEAIILFFLAYPFAHMALLLKNPPDSRGGHLLEGLFMCAWALSIVGLVFVVGGKAQAGELALRSQVLATTDILGLLYTVIILGVGGALVFHAMVMIPPHPQASLKADLAQHWLSCSERCLFRHGFISVFLLGMIVLLLVG